MIKKVLSFLIAVSMMLSLNFTVFAEDKEIIEFSAKNLKNFKMEAVAGKLETSEDMIILSHDKLGTVRFKSNDEIVLAKRNLTIKYKAMVEYDNSTGGVGAIMLRYFGKEGERLLTESYINTSAKPNVWYEGEVTLDTTKVYNGYRDFAVGDVLDRIEIDVKNGNALPFKLNIEYLKLVEPMIDTSFAPIPRLEDANHDVIADLSKKISEAKPGDTIIIPDGTYSNVSIVIPESVKGTEDKPIIIKAKTPGKVIINGLSNLEIGGSYVVVDGLYFKDGYFRLGAIKLTGTSNHCRLTNTAMINYNGSRNPAYESQWITIGGQYNQVDHCYFADKTGTGVMFEVGRSNGKNPDGHIIEYNYFGKYPKSGKNGTETIRYGLSSNCHSGLGESVFRYNFFEECNGEDEVISVKSMGSKYSYNTFYATTGSLTLRHGGQNQVNGNLFIGSDNGSNTTMGLRVIGPDQKVFDNYFLAIPDRANATTLECGVVSDAGDNYEPIVNLEFHNNTYVGCDQSIAIGTGYNGSSAQGKRVEVPQGKLNDNIFYSQVNGRPLAVQFSPEHKLEIENNVFYGKESQLNKEEPGLINEKPEFLQSEEGFLYLADGRGANVSEINKAPKNPMEIAPEWIVKLYESGELVFNPVSHDVFNRNSISAYDAVNDVLVMGLDKPYAYERGVKIPVDTLNDETKPIVINERTMVPIRFIAETYGATVDYNEVNGNITIKKKQGIWENKNVVLLERTVKLNVNGDKLSNHAQNSYSPFTVYQDDTITLDVPATVINERTYIPLRACMEAFGLNVHWDKSGVIVITPANEIANELKVDASKINRYIEMMGI